MATVTIGDNTGDDFSGCEDTFLKQNQATTVKGGLATMEVTKYGAGDHSHSLLSFSGISNLPSPLTVSSSTAYLNQVDNNGGTYDITAKKLNRNWVEAQATWNIYSTGNNWTTAGALHETDDRSSTETFSIAVDEVNEVKAFSSVQLAADVEDFADGTLNNYGWHLERDDAGEDSDFKQFETSEGDDTDRPYLSVTYTEAGGISIPLLMQQMDHFNGGMLNG